MAENHDAQTPDESAESPRVALMVTAASLLALAVSGGLLYAMPDTPFIKVPFLLMQVVVISLLIWQACDPFADAAQWIGTTLRVPGSVRGATLDAIASSMPELFSGIFFVVVAVVALDSSDVAAKAEAAAEGYGSTIATCAGSAIYNMILIPAVCALTIAFSRPKRPTIDVEPEVISRDGLWFMGCEGVLLFFLFQSSLHWWMAVTLLVLYVIYIFHLYRDARAHQRAMDAIHAHLGDVSGEVPTETIVDTLKADGIRATPVLVDSIRGELAGEDEEEDEPDSAGLLYGMAEIPLNHLSAWAVIGVSTVIAAVACYWLVEVTNETAHELQVPPFFVAVILAAAASSVPDTFLSLGSAKRGDDSGAVSNAFGSNIFDICICLAIPLLVSIYLNGWNPISLVNADGEPMEGLFGLRILLFVFSLVTLLIMWHNRQLTRNKALILCVMYLIFIGYAVMGSLGFGF